MWTQNRASSGADQVLRVAVWHPSIRHHVQRHRTKG